MSADIEIIVGRLEQLQAEAIVNAANRALLPGGGVDGAIRRAAGPALNDLLAAHGGLAEGEALVTPGFALPAGRIIHTVAPIWFAPGDEAEKIARLTSCYRACLEAARALSLDVIAFPAIGTGAFGWPRDLGARIALAQARAWTAPPARIVFCCFTEDDAAIYRAALG
jgi:O-acetyl-ADP-ribose deacetylase (regulator of RNase III)